MTSNYKMYVGAEVPAAGASPTGGSTCTQELLLLDTAFARRAQRVLQTTPLAVRQNPSAAASPILRWLLQMENKKQQPSETLPCDKNGKANSRNDTRFVEEGRNAEWLGNKAIDVSGSSLSAPVQPLAATALARRGVGPKDPLLQRLLKKQQHQQAKAAAKLPQTTATTTTAVSETSSITSSHWTQHSFSAMTATSWRVFRQQLGITIELVAPAKNYITATVGAEVADGNTLGLLNKKLAVPATPFSASSINGTAAAMPPAETLPAIRCWEEARLPLSLGHCVTAAYALPTAVQAQCVPLAILTSPVSVTEKQLQSPAVGKLNTTTATASSLGMDVLAVAETGSGKTAAYLVPLLYHVLCRAPKLLGHPDRVSLGPLSLVIVPTRELAEQVTTSLLLLCGQAGRSAGLSTAARLTDIAAWEAEESDAPSNKPNSGGSAERNWLSELRVVKVVGGESQDMQYNSLAQGAHCVVGTVGQLQTLLESRMLSLGNAQFVVMDEADRMIDEQQEEKLVTVLERCPTPRQTLMFTATLSGACAGVAKRYLSKSGYYLVRTPYRCSSIRQSFELMSATITAEGAEDTVSAAAAAAAAARAQHRPRHELYNVGDSGKVLAGVRAGPQQQQQRRLHPLIHPQKFGRLVTWLVYATGPIIVFANERATCDALFDELRAEAEHLDAQQEYYSLGDLVEPPPDGLFFRESNEEFSANIKAATASSPTANTRTSRHISLLNLTSLAVVHSELSQNERRNLVAQFQRRQRQVLITTDLLARGLDVAGVTLVVNYDVPWCATGVAADALTLYIHRIGRTGRAGSTGVAVTFITLPAAMVQRAEEVVKEESENQQGEYSKGRGDIQKGASNLVKGRAKADDDDADPISVMGELFDGDTHSVLVAGMSAVAAAAVNESDTSRNRKRRRDALDSGDDDEMTGGGMNGSNNGEDSEDSKRRLNRRAKAKAGFASDVGVLRPLWSFLTECAEGEGCKDGAAALRRGTYAKINVPPALACIMTQLSSTSQFGHITL